RTVCLPFLSTNSPEALERIVRSGGVFWKNLDGDAHLLQLYRKNRSQLFQDQLRLLLGTLVRIDRETNLSHSLLNSQRWMRRPGSRVDGVTGVYCHDLPSFLLYELSALFSSELEFAALHHLLGYFLRVGRSEVFLKLLFGSPSALA